MFVSQLYTGSISDKQIVTRSGFLHSRSSLNYTEEERSTRSTSQGKRLVFSC